jgi:hypothetical protein
MPDNIKKDYERAKDFLVPFFLPFNRLISYNGLENVISEGPNIIIANHPGVGKDIGGILRAYDRRLSFTASEFLFEKETLINKAKDYLGLKKYMLLKPLLDYLSGFLSERMSKFEMIPIAWEYTGDYKSMAQSLRKSIDKTKEYLRQGKATVFFQLDQSIIVANGTNHNKHKDKSQYHDYLYPFNNTVSKIAAELYKEGLSVPVTPIAFYGGATINPFERMKMSIGEPQYIDSYALEANGSKSVVPIFTDLLEQKIADMLVGMGIQRNLDDLTPRAKRKLFKAPIIQVDECDIYSLQSPLLCLPMQKLYK